MVYHSGVCLCNIARKHDVYKNGSRYPDRADTVKGETYLQLSEVGAAQVLWIYGAPNEVTEPVPAVIRFEARNTTAVGVWEDGNRDNRGLSEVLEFDDTVTIESIYPGVIKLDKNEGA
ncbi:MAG: hypothetical protein JXR97_09345 [Planctomycetes bacterium]|nr:hypothetical protein [Planctomycetota bacterium]